MRNTAITIVTSTRAEFGLLRPVVAKLCQNGPAPALVATGAHLCARLGGTVAEIEAILTAAECRVENRSYMLSQFS